MRGHVGQPVRIEEERALQPEEQVEQEREDGTEDHDRLRVALPVLLPGRVVADDAVEAALDRSEAEAPERRALGRVDPGHVEAERHAEHDQDDRVEDDLGDRDRAHKLLSAEECVAEVREDGQGDGEPEDLSRAH